MPPEFQLGLTDKQLHLQLNLLLIALYDLQFQSKNLNMDQMVYLDHMVYLITSPMRLNMHLCFPIFSNKDIYLFFFVILKNNRLFY